MKDPPASIINYVLGGLTRVNKKAISIEMALWAHLGSNQGPLDYESSALTS